MLVQFNSTRVVEWTDPKAFEERARRWLSMREGENLGFWEKLPALLAGEPKAGWVGFTLEEGHDIQAAGMLLPDQTLHLTWATHEVLEVLVKHASHYGWRIVEVHATGHTAAFFAWMYGQQTHQQARFGRGERVYQLGRAVYGLPASGHLEAVGEADRALAREWIEDYVASRNYDLKGQTLEGVVEALIGERRLYFWKNPEPMAMAVWGLASPRGARVDYVYTPPELRGQGYGKAVCAALGAQMLASGLRYCFILTGIEDERANGLCQGIGARTLCELTMAILVPSTMPVTPETIDLSHL
jgi:hypothetical protein